MDLKSITEILNEFEVRNNFSATLVIHSDGSGSINDFWNDNVIEAFNNMNDLISYLKTTKYKLDDKGRCISPLVKIN